MLANLLIATWGTVADNILIVGNNHSMHLWTVCQKQRVTTPKCFGENRVLSRAPQVSTSFAWVIIILNTSTHSSLFQHRALGHYSWRCQNYPWQQYISLTICMPAIVKNPVFRFQRGYWIGMVHLKTDEYKQLLSGTKWQTAHYLWANRQTDCQCCPAPLENCFCQANPWFPVTSLQGTAQQNQTLNFKSSLQV